MSLSFSEDCFEQERELNRCWYIKRKGDQNASFKQESQGSDPDPPKEVYLHVGAQRCQATNSRGLAGRELVLSSDEALCLEEFPERVFILGRGILLLSLL